jgi:hypothetical protein
MNGGTPLIDKLLAPASAQRSDLVPLKAQLAIYAADAVTDIEAIANDIRLPSRAAVERQLGVDPAQLKLSQPGGAHPAAGLADGTRLSAAARIISELLGSTPARGEAVRGSAPLWPAAAAPEPQQLAAALARSVAGSGLFYESHLLQFFSGQRSLPQLLQEPQAQLRLPSAAVDFSTDASNVPSVDSSSDPAADSSTSPLAATSANATTVSSHVTASIAADAIPLLRQQLELLALSQFRWSGEAWPGSAMEWEITEQGRRQQGGSENNPQHPSQSWSTSLSMTLPQLGSIELRLSLTGDHWRADLGAAQAATLSAMRADSEQLRQRFSAAGMHLSDLQVAQSPQAVFEQQSDEKK